MGMQNYLSNEALSISSNFHLCTYHQVLQYFHEFRMLKYDLKTNQVHD